MPLLFPSVEEADEDGLLGIGDDLSLETLVSAYTQGIFPWPIIDDQVYLTWFAPPQRAILWLDDFKPSHSLKRAAKRLIPEFTIDRHFPQVIQRCSEMINRHRQRASWITPPVIEAYTKLHERGFCHSIECSVAGDLVGGLYGVSIGAMFAGESMFYRRANCSKLALWHLIEHLRARQAKWIDCQVMTPFFASLGAVEIPRSEFTELLTEAITSPVKLFD